MAKVRRRKIERNFTTVENDFLRDLKLGATERGILMTMLSLPDNWDYSAAGLASILPDGKKKVNNSLQRLEKAGYLKRSRLYENGKVIDWLYEFCEQPIFKDENLLAQKGEVEENLFTPFVQVENVQVEKVEVEKGADNKVLKELSTKKSNSLFNQSINLAEEKGKSAPSNATNLPDRLIDGDLIENIKNQIDYNVAIQNHRFEEETIDLIVDSLAELYVASDKLTFGNVVYAPEVIRDRAAKFNSMHVDYVLEKLSEQTTKIRNIRKYLLTMVFNAPTSFGADADAEYRNTMASTFINTSEQSTYEEGLDKIVEKWGLRTGTDDQ